MEKSNPLQIFSIRKLETSPDIFDVRNIWAKRPITDLNPELDIKTQKFFIGLAAKGSNEYKPYGTCNWLSKIKILRY